MPMIREQIAIELDPGTTRRVAWADRERGIWTCQAIMPAVVKATSEATAAGSGTCLRCVMAS